jgi:hypothetical protein
MLNTAFLAMAALLYSVLAARDAAAVPITLNLNPSASVISVSGSFGGIPFVPQDTAPVQAGVTDLNAVLTSMSTTFGGTITVDVDNVNNPSNIQILSSNADADAGGLWLPTAFAPEDNNGDGQCCDFGLPPDGDSDPAEAAPPGPAVAGDWGLRIRHPAFGVTIALAAARDIVFNVTSPVEPVGVGGTFNSETENYEFSAGWLDYWVAPAAGGLQGRAELAGGDTDNAVGTPLSSYVVTPLPFNKRQITLTIPVNVDNPGDDADFFYDGAIVATLVVPEPSAIAMLCVGLVTSLLARRKRM